MYNRHIVSANELIFFIHGVFLWTEPFNLPPVRSSVSNVPEPVVQPTLPTLPKLHHVRHQPQPAPKFWHGNLFHSFKSPLKISHSVFQHLPPTTLLGQHFTLFTSPCPYPRPSRPQSEVRLTLLIAQSHHRPLNPNLPFQLVPPKRQTSSWVRPHVFGLSAGAPIAVNDKPGGVEFFEIDESAGNGA